jgi:transposase
VVRFAHTSCPLSLCEFAQAAARSRCGLKEKFRALSLRKGHKKSIVALAHKMLRIIFAMLKNHAPYQDQFVDYEELLVQRNAPRWIRTLVQYGYLRIVSA